MTVINLSCQIHPSRHFCERHYDDDGLTVTSGNFRCLGNLQSPEHVQERPLCVIFSKSLAFLPWHFCPNAPVHLHSSIFPGFCRGWQSRPAFPCTPPQQKLKKKQQTSSLVDRNLLSKNRHETIQLTRKNVHIPGHPVSALHFRKLISPLSANVKQSALCLIGKLRLFEKVSM